MRDLQKKSMRAEYEANREAIAAAHAAEDAEFIRQELKMTDWTEWYRDKLGIVAECTPTQAMWELWRKDRNYITDRCLQPTPRDGIWIVYCYNNEISKLLIELNS